MISDRTDVFDGHDQGDLFGAAAAPAYRPDTERVRRRVHGILGALRAEVSAEAWEYGRASFLRMVFPKLTYWLPSEEAARLEAEFATEMERLGAA